MCPAVQRILTQRCIASARILTQRCIAQALHGCRHPLQCVPRVPVLALHVPSHLGVFELLEHRARAGRSPRLVLSTGRWLALGLCGAEGGKCCRPGAAPAESGMAEIRSRPGILRMGLSFCYLLTISIYLFIYVPPPPPKKKLNPSKNEWSAKALS